MAGGVEFSTPGQRAYSHVELERAMHANAWLEAQPNRPHPQDLPPQFFSIEGVERVVEAMLDPAISRVLSSGRNSQQAWNEAPKTLQPGPQLGTLTKVAHGETRVCYRLDHELGKMAVLFGMYDAEVGVQTPADHRMTLLSRSTSRRLWTYSDLRTYLVLPVGRYTGVFFQEWGGDTHPSGAPGALLAGVGRRLAMANAQRNLAGIDNTMAALTKLELRERRHALYKPGNIVPAIIDVPVEERIR